MVSTATETASDVARTLKRLREKSGLSMPEMARACGMKKSSYQHYEDRFKKRELPVEILEPAIRALRARGISEDDLADLLPAGRREGDVSPDLGALIEEMRRLREEVHHVRVLLREQQGAPAGLREEPEPYEADDHGCRRGHR